MERILEVCQSSNIGDNIDYSIVKEAKIIQRSVEILIICKQIYQYFYKHFGTMIRTLPPSDLLQFDLDLQHYYYFIDFKSNFKGEEILNTFCEFITD